MSGLRARNKADRRRRILDAATRLFREQGYEATRIEAIAAEADVSVGTIYNYYQNKGDILVAIVSMEVDEVLVAGARIIAAPPAHVVRAIDRLLMSYIDHSLVYLSKEMWRQAMAISTQQPNSPFGRTYAALDKALVRQTCSLIAALQSLGAVRPDVDSRGVGEMLFNNTNMMFIEFVKDEAMPLVRLRSAIRRQNRTLLSAIAVPAPAA
ncbi:MAG: helix-turn-helix domain-containing protein [Aestuariivirgaceae bacterium]